MRTCHGPCGTIHFQSAGNCVWERKWSPTFCVNPLSEGSTWVAGWNSSKKKAAFCRHVDAEGLTQGVNLARKKKDGHPDHESSSFTKSLALQTSSKCRETPCLRSAPQQPGKSLDPPSCVTDCSPRRRHIFQLKQGSRETCGSSRSAQTPRK